MSHLDEVIARVDAASVSRSYERIINRPER